MLVVVKTVLGDFNCSCNGCIAEVWLFSLLFIVALQIYFSNFCVNKMFMFKLRKNQSIKKTSKRNN